MEPYQGRPSTEDLCYPGTDWEYRENKSEVISLWISTDNLFTSSQTKCNLKIE